MLFYPVRPTNPKLTTVHIKKNSPCSFFWVFNRALSYRSKIGSFVSDGKSWVTVSSDVSDDVVVSLMDVGKATSGESRKAERRLCRRVRENNGKCVAPFFSGRAVTPNEVVHIMQTCAGDKSAVV